MRIEDSRRIIGAHFVIPAAGAVAEIKFEGERDPDAWLLVWEKRAKEILAALGWNSVTGIRRYRGGASVGVTAPVDLLLAATFVVEEAAGFGPGLEAIRDEIRRSTHLPLREAVEWARRTNQTHSWDEDQLTIGQGCYGITWPTSSIPKVAEMPSPAGVRTVLVTGTNGKTTTSRLIAHGLRTLGHTPGLTTSDGIQIGDAWVTRGDWTGPGAARRVLRDPLVDVAVLETARGGYMRRGLATERADMMVLTNVTGDHLGEWGLTNLEELLAAKLSIVQGVRPGGILVFNETNPELRAAAHRLMKKRGDLRAITFTDGPGGDVLCRDGAIVAFGTTVAREDDFPITLGGRLRHNVENVLAAGIVMHKFGLDWPDAFKSLRTFRPEPKDSRGRSNLFGLRGATVFVDFAHTPDAILHLRRVARAGRGRSTLVLGQAGDRTDELIDELGVAAAALGLDRYLLKEMPRHLRGRAPGEVTARLRAALLGKGIPESNVVDGGDERQAILTALRGVRAGDRIVLLVHDDLEAVLQDLAGAGAVPLEKWPEGG